MKTKKIRCLFGLLLAILMVIAFKSTVSAEALTEPETQSTATPSITVTAHVQDIGWQTPVTAKAGETLKVGTSGQSKRLEALSFTLKDAPEGSAIKVRSHVQNIGWQDIKEFKLNSPSQSLITGTEGKSLRLEAVELTLTGPIADDYDIYYRAHVQNYGWLGWTKNGLRAGSEGYSLRLEALEIKLTPKVNVPQSVGDAYIQPYIGYSAHSQNVGWGSFVWDGATAGTTGRSLRLEAIKINKPDINGVSGNIYYQVEVIGKGWLSEVSNGQIGGTVGESRAIDAIKIRMDGTLGDNYDVYYRLHTANIGWMNWAKNGEPAGTEGLSKRAEAIQIKIVKKGGSAPSGSGAKYIYGYAQNYFKYKGGGKINNTSAKDFDWVKDGVTLGAENDDTYGLNNITLSYTPDSKALKGDIVATTKYRDEDWTKTTVSVGNMIGTSDGSKKLEAIKLTLTGDLKKYYSVWYRVNVTGKGWLGWAKDGQAAGTEKVKKLIKAIQIKLVSIDASAPGANSNYFYNGDPITITISSMGDVTLGTDKYFSYAKSLNAYYAKYGSAYFFKNVRSILQADNLSIVNMEGVLTTSNARASKTYAFKGDAAYTKILTDGSVEAANLANNHSHDYGESSYWDTISALNAAGIKNFGYDRTVIMEVKGIKIGLTGIYELGSHMGCQTQLKNNIASLKKQGAQLIIVNFHWGVESSYSPNSTQTALAHMAVDAGANLVIGHHPHVLQGVELYKGAYIAYSLGNFCFGGNSNPKDKDTMIFQQTFKFDADGKLIPSNNINIIPCKVSTVSGYNDYVPTPATGAEKTRIYNKIKHIGW